MHSLHSTTPVNSTQVRPGLLSDLRRRPWFRGSDSGFQHVWDTDDMLVLDYDERAYRRRYSQLRILVSRIITGIRIRNTCHLTPRVLTFLQPFWEVYQPLLSHERDHLGSIHGRIQYRSYLREFGFRETVLQMLEDQPGSLIIERHMAAISRPIAFPDGYSRADEDFWEPDYFIRLEQLERTQTAVADWDWSQTPSLTALPSMHTSSFHRR